MINRRDLEQRIKTRRMEKRIASKNMLNLHVISDLLDQVITELTPQAKREPELAASIDVILAAKKLIKAYGQRILNEPFK